MTCANWGLTIFSLIILVVTIWPVILGASLSMWIVAVCAILILLLAWTGVECKFCKANKVKAVQKPKKRK